MHQQAKLPEISDQIPKNTQVFWDLVPEHPPPENWKTRYFLSRFQIWPYPEHPPQIEN